MQSCNYRSDMILKRNWSVKGWCGLLAGVYWYTAIIAPRTIYLAFPGGGSAVAARPHSDSGYSDEPGSGQLPRETQAKFCPWLDLMTLITGDILIDVVIADGDRGYLYLLIYG